MFGKTRIIKLLPTGNVDVNYGQKGFSSFSDILPASAVMQPDGKIVVGGNINNNFGVTRYNTNGSIDIDFADGGIKSFYGGQLLSNEVALQADGKIVLAGSTYDVYPYNSVIELERLNTDGSYDTTFNKDGSQEYGAGGDISATSIVIQNDNRIVVSVSNDYENNDFTLLRYNANGSIDSSFSEDGIQTTSFTDANGNSLQSVISSTIIQPDGKIVATGSCYANMQNFLCLARYNTDGSLDSSFSNDGKQITTLTPGESSIAIQDDGKIILSGSASLSRYNTNGSLDSTFGKNGIQTTDFQIASIVTQNGKKILSQGHTFNYDNFVVARFNNNGSPDKTFDNDGKFVSAIEDRNTTYTNTAIQKDKKIISVGNTFNGSNFDFLISRYNFDGSTDNTFHSNGKQTTDFSSKDDYADAAVIQNDGKIVVAGHSVKNDSSSFSLARYNTDGSLDNTFSGDGLLNVTVANNANTTETVIIQKDGKILLAGSALIRFNADGSPDNTFNHNGILNPPFTTHKAVIQNDGKIVVAGSYKDNFAVARFNTNGSIDSSFSGDGIQIRNFDEFYDYSSSVAYSVAIQDNGKIIAGGHCDCDDYYDSYSVIVANRFNTDGSFDSTFSAFNEDYGNFGFSGSANSVDIQNDGKIIIADIPDNRFLRINRDGSFDPNFSGPLQDYSMNSLKIADENFYTTGYTTPVIRGVLGRYFYNDSSNPAPVVSITAPANNAIFHLGQHIKFNVSASDPGGSVDVVFLFSNDNLLDGETVAPYGTSFYPLYTGNFTLTAIAYDNTGLATISEPVHISVVSNKPPVVSIIKPANDQSFAAPAYIHFEAAASDDGKIMKVEFYHGSTLLGTEYKHPYTYVWKDVPRGIHIVTAVATDNYGVQTTSAPIAVRVTSGSAIVSSRPSSKTEKTTLNDALHLRLSPNPATNIVNIYTKGLQYNKPATLSIISTAGILLKTMQISNSASLLDVSSLASGVYTLKIISGDKVLYKQFVKL